MNSLGVALLQMEKMQTNLLGECVITMNDWPGGIYFVRMTNPMENVVVKFVKN